MLVLSMSTDLKNRSSKADSKAWISERNGVAPGNSIRLDYGTFHQAESEACGMTPLSAIREVPFMPDYDLERSAAF